MMLRCGLLGLGVYIIVSGFMRRSALVVALGAIVLLVAAALFQAQRVAKKWHDEGKRLGD